MTIVNTYLKLHLLVIKALAIYLTHVKPKVIHVNIAHFSRFVGILPTVYKGVFQDFSDLLIMTKCITRRVKTTGPLNIISSPN